MSELQSFAQTLQDRFTGQIQQCIVANDEITLELEASELLNVCQALRSESGFQFETLLDVCGVDYLQYGEVEWQTESRTYKGFSRAVQAMPNQGAREDAKGVKRRFASIYHLLSLSNNRRLRLRSFPEGEPPRIPSVIDIWPSANWYEREAFDLFGILYEGHPDLRRILTDYGFIGHPFRKDFPLTGEVEMRFDATLGRCVYEPVSIEPRTVVPKVIREDNRYISPESESSEPS